jgi:antiviral helicase SLH1
MIPNLKVDLHNVNALSLTVVLNRLNSLADKDGKMYAPRFPKSQTEGWFVILCNADKDEIIAIKRVGWNSRKDEGGPTSNMKGARPNARALIKFPEEEHGGFKDGRKFDVWAVSDGYLGIIYKIDGVEIPDVPKVVDDGKKERVKDEGLDGAGASGA